AAARNDARRPFTLTFNGEGERRVAFGYVLDMPQWKPTYRLTLNENGKGAFLQGWALVENRTDTDWEGLQLSLVAGSPNNLKTLLYDYGNKPTGDDAEDEDVEDMCMEEDGASAKRMAGMELRDSYSRHYGAVPASPPAAFNAASSKRQACGREMGEMFAYDDAAPVTLARRQATMLEIVAGEISAEKVLYYNPSIGGQCADDCPDNALYLKNDTGKVMLAGPVAVFDEGYGGDATLEHLPQGGEAVLRYGRALDIKAETHDFDESAYVAVKFHRGTLEVRRRVTENFLYIFRNPGEKAHTLLLDVPQRRGWTLADGLKPWKDANHCDTFRIAIPAGQDTKFAYGRFRIEEETFILTDAKQWSRAVSICSHGILTDAQKKAWKKAGELHAQVKEAEKRLADDEQALKELSENQERTRQNLDALADEQSDFHRQLVARLAEEIKQTDARQQAIKQRRAELRAAEQALVDYLQGLEL
ncbi:MAG: hypothetical protein J6333_11490, partial [Planctomycetes bacterium]|nr:hypothetical protein [Planctomycetota bacterium]